MTSDGPTHTRGTSQHADRNQQLTDDMAAQA